MSIDDDLTSNNKVRQTEVDRRLYRRTIIDRRSIEHEFYEGFDYVIITMNPH